MSIKYRMKKINDHINPEGERKTGYYPRVVRVRTVYLDELAERAAEETTMNAAEIKLAVALVLQQTEKELLDSNHVCLDGFVTISLSAESRPVEDPDEIRAESIHVKRLAFKTSKQLMKAIRNAKFERAK